MSEEFEKWWSEIGFMFGTQKATYKVWQARQSEIDALKLRADSVDKDNALIISRIDQLKDENAALKAENERLQKDAEKSIKAYSFLDKSFERNIVAMQAAFIEWQHGRGAKHGMQWIANTLWGPGLIPDENEPNGKDAQAYFDTNAPDFNFDALDAAMKDEK